RWPRDWSSDVCSSDLAEAQPLDAFALRVGPWRLDLPTRLAQAAIASAALSGAIEVAGVSSIPVVLLALVLRFLVDFQRVEVRTRSEERRVGKECRVRW